MWTGPTASPTASAATRNAHGDEAGAEADAPRLDARCRLRSAGRRGHQLCLAIRATDTRELHDPRPPARGDVVVGAVDAVVLHRVDRAPARSRGDRRCVLPAALRVGEDDDLRVLRDDVLGRQLRVAAAGRVRRVGDVLEAEQPVDAADERLRRRRVVRRVELVVDPQVAARLRHAPHDRRQLRLHRMHQRLSGVAVTGQLADPADLPVRLRQVVRRRLHHDLDPQLPELRGEVVGVVRDEHEIRVVAGDGLGVRVVAGEARPRRALRVVRVLVDRDDLLAGADREQILGHRRRQRDDAVVAVLDVLLLVRGRREGHDGQCGGQCGGKRRDDNKGTVKHESSFREGFGFGGGRQVF